MNPARTNYSRAQTLARAYANGRTYRQAEPRRTVTPSPSGAVEAWKLGLLVGSVARDLRDTKAEPQALHPRNFETLQDRIRHWIEDGGVRRAELEQAYPYAELINQARWEARADLNRARDELEEANEARRRVALVTQQLEKVIRLRQAELERNRAGLEARGREITRLEQRYKEAAGKVAALEGR